MVNGSSRTCCAPCGAVVRDDDGLIVDLVSIDTVLHQSTAVEITAELLAAYCYCAVAPIPSWGQGPAIAGTVDAVHNIVAVRRQGAIGFVYLLHVSVSRARTARVRPTGAHYGTSIVCDSPGHLVSKCGDCHSRGHCKNRRVIHLACFAESEGARWAAVAVGRGSVLCKLTSRTCLASSTHEAAVLT